MPQPAGFDNGVEDASPSYLYPHSRPPGTLVPHRAAETANPALRERAVIGNELCLPAVWCDFGACIERYSDPDALGMRDIRRRSAAAGWRQDAFGRLACPRCQQADPAFRAMYPVAVRSLVRGRPAGGDWR